MVAFYFSVSTVKNFVFVNENQFTWRSSQNYTLSYYRLTISESNRLIVSVICARLSIKAISITSQKHEQHDAEQLNHKLHTEWSRERGGDFDLTGNCAWKRDRKCSTWRMRRRFAAVFISHSFVHVQREATAPSLRSVFFSRDLPRLNATGQAPLFFTNHCHWLLIFFFFCKFPVSWINMEAVSRNFLYMEQSFTRSQLIKRTCINTQTLRRVSLSCHLTGTFREGTVLCPPPLDKNGLVQRNFLFLGNHASNRTCAAFEIWGDLTSQIKLRKLSRGLRVFIQWN